MLDNPQSMAGIITKTSSKSVPQTVDRLTRVIAEPLAGLDLPLKVLVWEDGKGAVAVTYNAPEFLAERHHIEGALRAPFDAVESIVEQVVGQ